MLRRLDPIDTKLSCSPRATAAMSFLAACLSPTTRILSVGTERSGQWRRHRSRGRWSRRPGRGGGGRPIRVFVGRKGGCDTFGGLAQSKSARSLALPTTKQPRARSRRGRRGHSGSGPAEILSRPVSTFRHACIQHAATHRAIAVEGCEEYSALVLESLVDAAGGQAHRLGQFADRRSVIAALGKDLQRLVQRRIRSNSRGLPRVRVVSVKVVMVAVT